MDKKQNGGKPPSQSTTINIPTTRQQSLNKIQNSPTTATSLPIPIPDKDILNKKTTEITSKISPIPTSKVSSTTGTSSGSNSSSNSSSSNKIKKPQPSMSISPSSGFTKPSSAPSTFGGGMLSRMQQQQQQLLRNPSNNNQNSIVTTNSGFLRPVGIPISSSFNQSKSNNNNNNNNILKMSDNSSYSSNSSISPRNHYSGGNRNVMMSTSSDSSTSTSPNFSGFMNKQSPNSYYSGFGIPSSFSSSSSPTSSSPIGSGGGHGNNNHFPKPTPSIYLRPSPPGSFHTPASHNSFLMPSPQSASEVYGSKNSNQTFSSLPIPPNNNQPKTKTIGFDVSSSSSSSSSNNKTSTTSTTTTTTPTKNRTRRSTSLLLYGSIKEEQTIPAHDLEFDSQDSDGSENGDDFFDDDDDYKHKEDNDHLLKSPPPKETSSLIKNNNNNNNNSNNNNNIINNNNSNSNIGNSKASFVNIENLDSLGIERIVMEGWKKQIPRFHQKDACVKIVQNIVEQFKIDSKKIVPLSPATPLSTPHSPLSSSIMSAPSSTNSDYSNYSNTTTTTNNSSYNQQHQQHNNQVIKPIKNAKNYLIQHAPGSGKSHTIACLVTNLYRLLEDHKLKYDLILILNDKRHLDIQLGSIITQFLKDNELTSIIHPSTIALLEKILIKAKTRVIITTVQKFTTIIERESNKFEQISSKYKSIAIVSDDLKTMSDRFSSILTSSETREANNITYFCFTSTPKPKILELFGDTRGNLRVPFHTYSIEKALQDKIVMNVIDNYTTVAILTKVSNEQTNTNNTTNNNNNSNSDKSSYHILKHSNNDKKIIQEKSSYIIKHFIKLREQINNQDFDCRSILVASSREQILLYKTTLETLIKALPKNQRFDVIASFARFELKKKEKAEYDEKINGTYAHYFEKRNGISEIIKNDTKHRVQLIIVADKLQTGFDEPSLAVMYVDRPLKGSTAVQTIGRLSRVAKGKSACYVVDFINTRREISDAFGQYWRETCLKGATRKTVLEKKLTRILGKLSLIEPLANGRLEESVEYILRDDEKRKKERKVGSITDDITQYFELCNQLLWDNSPPMNTKFLELVKYHVCDKRLNHQMTSIRGLLQNIENKSTILNQQQQQQQLQLQQQQLILPDSSTNLINTSVSGSGNGGKKQLPTTTTRKLSNSQYFYQDGNGGKLSSSSMIKQESGGKFDYQMKEEEMDLDAENLEFAREIWSSNPEIKLHSRLLGNDKDEDEMDDIGFNLKMFENAETIEQVIGIVVEFVSRNGQTFENVIQNQSMSAIFPFIDPHDSNYQIYKSKLDKARAKYNVEQQKLIQLQLKEQQQYKEQQLIHVQQLKEQQIYNNIHHHHGSVGSHSHHYHVGGGTDIVMGESSNLPYGQIQFQLQTPWNNQDIPLPIPLPVITIDQVVGKPHAKGKLTDDCLLDDCVLSFCNDLDTKDPNDAPLRVYAIKVLGMLTNKGIHKNTLHEIVGSIHKILLNPKESISIKMIALDLLALVASQDEVTITQILDFGLIVTIVKLIESAEEPLKAKCCKFFSVLHDEVAIVSALIECQGISVITQLLESYDYLLVEQALRCLVSLSTEDRTIKMIRTSMDPNVVSRLEHHKIQVIHDLINQLKSLISGSKRTLQQFQPLLTSKRIRSNSNSQKKLLDNSSNSISGGLDGLSKSSNIIKNRDGDNSISLSNSSPNISIPPLISPPLINDDNSISSTTTTTTTTTTPTPIQTRSRSILSTL